MKNKKSSGFTIVELLIVIVVIGILAAIIIVAYNGIQARARTSSQQADARAVSTQASMLQIDGYSFTDPRTWKQSLVNARLYDSASMQTTSTIRVMAVCSNSTDFVVAAWPPGVAEADLGDIVVSYGTRLSSLHWNTAIAGVSTIDKFCKQVNLTPVTFSNWAHNTAIRDAVL